MKKKFKSVLLFLLVSLSWSFDLTAESNINNRQENHIPQLIESIRFEEAIEFCGSKIPLDRPQVRERLEKEMLLALWDRPQVILWVKRSSKYFPHIESILTKNGLPLDYKYIPVIESGLRPHAGSSKGAVGFWQFLRSTGRRQGLIINSYIDERRNVFKSTRAACRYLKTLNQHFNSHFLSLAAYNMGEYGLKKEIKAQENVDFFSLYLPLETQRYVLKLVCAKMIIEKPEAYGFFFDKSDLYPLLAFDEVVITAETGTPIILVAKAAGTSFREIKEMNPELRGFYLQKGQRALLLPKGMATSFNAQFDQLYRNWQQEHRPKIHIVKKGENLTLIAKRYNLTLSKLLRLNNFSQKKVIHPGERIVVK